MFSFFKKILSKPNFLRDTPKPNNVLLVETNGCHGEVIAAYIKYFQNLNINVYCLVNKHLANENPFCRLNNICKIYSASLRRLHKLLKIEHLRKYDHIFIMSSINYKGGGNNIPDMFPDLQKHKSVYYVHHESQYISEFYSDTDTNHNIMLGKYDNCTYINPHLFGDYTIPAKQSPTTFICVGGIEPERKNHKLLLNAIQQLHDEGHLFQVLIIGYGHLKKIPKATQKHIKILGHLDYPDMYKYVELSHFFLPLLDPDNNDHEKYITSKVTGSAQLIYGFKKIPVIHNKFANFYRFNKNNAILYDDLTDGMRDAIKSTTQQYKKYIQELDNTATEIETESEKNLQKILSIGTL